MNKSYVAMVKKIQFYGSAENRIKLTPLDGKPQVILRKIMDLSPILIPKEAFTFSVTSSSTGKLNEQASFFYKSILLATDRNDFALANYELDKLKFLYEILGQDSLSQKYKESVSFVGKKLKQLYDLEISSFNRYCTAQSVLTQEDINKYKNAMATAQKFDPYRIVHFSEYNLEKEIFDQNLMERVKDLISLMSNNSLEDQENIKILDKIYLLSNEFELHKNIYTLALEEIHLKIKHLVDSTKNHLETQEYAIFSSEMSKLQIIQTNLQKHVNILEYDNLKEEFLNEFEKKEFLIKNILSKDKIEDDDIATLKLEISYFEKVKSDLKLQTHISMEKFRLIDDKVLGIIKNFFKKAEEDLNKAFNDENLSDLRRNQLLNSLELCLKRMKDIKSISMSVALETSESYSSVLNILKLSMDKLNSDIETILNTLSGKMDTFNFNWKKLEIHLVILNTCSWMQDYVDNLHSFTKSKIEASIYEYAENLKCKIREIQIDFSKPAEMTKAIELFISYTSFNQMSDFFPKFKFAEDFEKIKLEFEDQLKLLIFDKIESMYINSEKAFENISNKKVTNYNNYLENILESNAPIFIKKPTQKVNNDFKSYLSKYYNFLLLEFKKNLDEIRNFEGFKKDEEKIIINVENLYNILKKITTLPQIKEVNDDDLQENPIVTLNKFYGELESKMSGLKSKNLWKECYIKIKIANNMIDLDKFLQINDNPSLKSNRSFKKLYSEYDKYYSDLVPDIQKQASTALKDYDFASINEIIDNLTTKRSDVVSKQILDKIKSDLQKKFNYLIKQIITEAKDEFPVEPKTTYFRSFEKANQIDLNTKLLESAKTHLSTALQNEMKVEHLIEDAKNMIESNLEENLLNNLQYIETNELEIIKFIDFENHLTFITNIVKHFETYALKKIKQKISEIQVKRSEILERLEKKYENIRFDELKILKDAKKDLSNLKDIKDNKLYVVSSEKIENIVEGKLHDQLATSQLNYNSSKLKIYIEKINKNISNNIDDPLKSRLISIIDDVNKEVVANREIKEQEIDKLIALENFNKINEFYVENLDATFIKDKINEYVKNLTDSKIKLFEKELAENKISQTFQTLKNANEIFEIFKNNFKYEIEKQNMKMKKTLNMKFQDSLCILIIFFNRENNPVPEPNDKLKNSMIFIFECMKIICNDAASKMFLEYFDNFESSSNNLIKVIKENYHKNQLTLNNFSLPNQFNVKEIKLCLQFAQSWDEVLIHSLNNVHIFQSSIPGSVNEIKELNDSPQKTTMVENVKTLLKNIEKEIAETNIEQNFDNQKQQLDFYKEIKLKKDIIQEASTELTPFMDGIKNVIQKLNEMDKTKLANLIRDLNELIAGVLDDKNCKQINENLTKLIFIFENLRKSDQDLEKTIDDIKNKLISIIANLYKNALNEQKIEKFATILIEIKIISFNIYFLKEKTSKQIDELLSKYKKDNGGETSVIELGLQLENDVNGRLITEQHKVFKGFKIGLFNQRIPKYSIDQVLEKLEGVSINTKKLREKFEEYEVKNKEIIQENLRKDMKIDKVINELKTLIKDLGNTGVWGAFTGKIKDQIYNEKNERDINWSGNIKGKLHIILAYIFAIWTLLNAENFFELDANMNKEKKDSYLFMPHCAQVISILRLFGLGDENNTLQNNLVQIGTGEGKSVTLAVVSSIFALLGFDISCACYSEYLSARDYNSFLTLFEKLGLVKDIHYGTFNALCERVINENGEIRKIIPKYITVNVNEANIKKDDPKKPKILLIDEVDVFFSKDFYGQLYTPSASINDPSIDDLMMFIWNNRNKITLNKIILSTEYKKCKIFFKSWSFILDEAIKIIISDSRTFESHGYIIKDNKIGYKEQDNIAFNIVMGYKTFFAYISEVEKGNIQRSDILNKLMSININCGNFSYANIPLKPNFHFIMGVTGTLNTLNKFEENVIENEYNIKKKTFSPSVFGPNKLSYNEKEHIKICEEKDYVNEIFTEITERLIGMNDPSHKRAVIVVFEDKIKLMNFYENNVYIKLQRKTSILTEENNAYEKDRIVREATMADRVTLITRTFGRGTDFVCRDEKVGVQGGVHVIQTFFSKNLSEEVQIKGRTARQGDKGSYSMVLLENELEYFMGNEKIDKNSKSTIYEVLNKKRNEKNCDDFNNNKKFIDYAQKKHAESIQFIKDLENSNDLKIKEYLKKENLGTASFDKNTSRTIVLMDATGSMHALLEKAKTTVFEMFQRAALILQKNYLNPDCFALQFAVYRNYSNSIEEILEHSPWETKPNNLWNFMKSITVKGGLGNEAIEVGLDHANLEATSEFGISQVILIGDAPGNTDQEISNHKKDYFGSKYWKNSKFGLVKNWRSEIDKLRMINANVKIHSFYVDGSAQKNFEEIARLTGGNCAFLDVNNIKVGAELLTKMVTEEILRNIGETNGMGDVLVESYRKAFT